ncbi:MAG: DNA topoisomerase III, partial [Oscillospiraceae bacterium]|nr:DNA topoisomerase III [Oscillospiraceae bacterium]
QDCKEQFAILKKLMQDDAVTEIICATDADREGECIFRYVYDLAGCRKPVKRLWVSSLEEFAIRDGFAKLKSSSEYDSLYNAGFCRARADWLVGMNGSRLFSIAYKQRLNLGRVQTPTLAMIVQRDHDVANFVKQKYFTVGLLCSTENGSFIAETERIDDPAKASALAAAVTGKTATVTELKKEQKTSNPPKLYDLTTLQRECNKFYGYTAQQTLNALQGLYEAKLATYPRTDSQYLSDDMEQTALRVIEVIGTVFPEYANPSPDIRRCINNAKVTGHHAIIPTESIRTAVLSKLPDEQRNVLLTIAAKLMMATAKPQKYESTIITVRCEETDFKASGKRILDDGWKAMEAHFKAQLKSKDTEQEAADDDQKLPELAQGQMISHTKGEVQEHWTSPPKPYTEDTLLTAMEHAGQDEYDEETEKKGLGTPATRAAVIEGLVLHGYIERKKKQIISTDRGRSLIAVVPEAVKSPKLTAEWEM